MHLKTICQLIQSCPKTQVSKIIQSGGFLFPLLSKLAVPLMKVAVFWQKNVLASLGITVGASVIDVGIRKKMYDSGTTTLILSKKEMDDIMNIVQALEDSNILLKRVAKSVKNETKRGLLGMLLDTLGASFSGNMLARKVMLRSGYRNKEGNEMLGAGYEPSIKKEFVPSHP